MKKYLNGGRMTEKLTKGEIRELMRERMVPILLDQSAKAHTIAARLFLKYGVISFLCGKKQALATRLNPFCRFHRLDRNDDRLAAEQLTDFSEEFDDCLFFLLPLSEKDRAFVSAFAQLLESRLILANPKSLLAEAPFARCH